MQNVEDKEDGVEGAGGLLGRLTRRGAWRGIVGPYLGKKPQTQANYDGKRTTIADVESSDEGMRKGTEPVDELDEERGMEFEEVDQGRGVRAETGVGDELESSGVERGKEGEDSWLQNLIQENEGEEIENAGKERLDGEGVVKPRMRRKRDNPDGLRREELDTGSGGVEESEEGGASTEESAYGITKEGVKTFLAVNADLASGGAEDEAVSGAGGKGETLRGAGKKPKPREIVEEESEFAEGAGARLRNPGGSWEAEAETESERETGTETEMEKETGTETETEMGADVEEDGDGEAAQERKEFSASKGKPLLVIGTASLGKNRSVLLQNSSEARFNRSAAVHNSTAALVNSSILLNTSFPILANNSTAPQNASAALSNGTLALANGSSPADAKSTAKSWPLVYSMKRKIWEAPKAGVKMPPREEFTLRQEMVEHRAVNNTIVVTFANFAFLDFTTNWVRHLTDLGVTNILVGECRRF